ncbi:MAG TPA: 5-oxoprolinase subunit PxpB [Anaeromyxobacteraceae bacterium]|nr:5-oxoprolinase subunit PxpB [Anaeromyxobacteraceae bacterium]
MRPAPEDAATAPGYRMLAEGEGGLVVELGDAIDPVVNARVHALARAISDRLASDVLEVVPTYRSLLVVFDPLRVERGRLERRVAGLLSAAREGGAREASRTVRVPVAYGGAAGPDLDFVAAHNGLTPAEVVEIHSSTSYLVFMLGFTPGFPYLGGMSGRIAAPRLDSPRTRIPAGSVGIAGAQTGIYPVESPGGWRLIGRTPLRLFDPGAERPFLLAAGDHVRFVPVSEEEWREIEGRVRAGGYEPDADARGEGGR